MLKEKTRSKLYEYVRENGGVAEWATHLEISAPAMYAKLSGRRPIFPSEAVIIEKKSLGRFTKEQLIFGKA